MIAYGLDFDDAFDPLQREMFCIQQGGRWKIDGVEFGEGLEHHYEQMRCIIWPELDSHRWWKLCRDRLIQHKVCVIMGPGSSGKTHAGACMYLMEYWCFPHDTCVLVSSTDIRGLRMRVWGEVTMLWQKGKDRFPYLDGHLLESRIAITTDKLMDGDYKDRRVRDMRKGIVGIPTVEGSKNVGMGKWQGMKQKRVRLLADEAPLMNESFLLAFSNLNNNEDFRSGLCGNPNDTLDPMGKAAEPIDGWDDHLEPEKTSEWPTKFFNGWCVNLVGTDSPNFDYPDYEPTRFPYLISRQKIAETVTAFAKDTPEYYSQCVGVMKIGLLARRVLTRELIKKYKCREQVIWKTGPAFKIAALDSAYGGDRAVLGHAEVGLDIDGLWIIAFQPAFAVPITLKGEEDAEHQLSDACRTYCEKHGIPPENFFHDSTGRGSLGTSLAQVWSDRCNPVEFGGAPTDRPVSLDIFIYDMKLKKKRLKKCSEHYIKFVTELWYSIRMAAEAYQIRQLPPECAEELCQREWNREKTEQKIELETKKEMKLRVGVSPDHADWAAIIVEGARRRGFQIKKLANHENKNDSMQWLVEMKQKRDKLTQTKQLSYRR